MKTRTTTDTDWFTGSIIEMLIYLDYSGKYRKDLNRLQIVQQDIARKKTKRRTGWWSLKKGEQKVGNSVHVSFWKDNYHSKRKKLSSSLCLSLLTVWLREPGGIQTPAFWSVGISLYSSYLVYSCQSPCQRALFCSKWVCFYLSLFSYLIPQNVLKFF